MATAIGVRSPFFASYAFGGTAYGTLELTISGTLRYTITKDVVPGTSTVTFDISELVRDYIQPVYDGTIVATDCGAVAISYVLKLFNSGGTQVATSGTVSYDAFDAYQNYYGSANYTLPTGVLVSVSGIYAPTGTAGFVFENDGSSVTVQTFSGSDTVVPSTSVKINRFPCGRYSNYALTFINRYGVQQQLWFTAKEVTSLSTKGSKYKSKYNAANGANDGFRHQTVDYNKNGLKQFTLNSDFITANIDDINFQLEELMLSEYVWLDDPILGFPLPVNVVTSNVTFKTGLNDRLVNYEVVVQTAFDLISTAR
jgi:hypothetical protein